MVLKKYVRFAQAVVFIAILAITLACLKVAPANKPSAPAPQGNQPPVISSLTASQNQTYPGGAVNLQSIVSDPEGDSLNYKWTASAGSFVETGRGNNTWRAPKDFGNYEIKLTVDDGKGGTAQSTVSITVSANHPPVITSLTAEPTALEFAQVTTLSCIANDPDGDNVDYKWDAKDGTLSGVGNTVSWTSPSKNGNFSVFVTVSDGKGAETKQELVIPVASVSSVQTISMIKEESGTVTSEGDRDSTIYKAGDDEKNIGYRAFFSYNIFALSGMEIKQARLKFLDTRVVGDDPFDPITGVGGYQLRHLTWSKTLPKFGLMEGGPLERAESYYNKPITEVDVTPELTSDIANKLDRFQVEAAFMKHTTNGNNVAQYVQWSDVVLEVTAAPK